MRTKAETGARWILADGTPSISIEKAWESTLNERGGHLGVTKEMKGNGSSDAFDEPMTTRQKEMEPPHGFQLE